MDTNPDGTGKQPDNKDGATPDAAGGNDGAKKDGSDKTYSAAELQAEVDRRVNQAAETIRAKIKAEAEAAQTQAAKEAEEKKLQEQGEFKKLLETRESELAELRKQYEESAPFADRAKKAEETLAAYAKTEITALGLEKQPAIMELIQDKSPTEQLAWIAKHKDSLKANPGGGLPDTPSDSKNSKMSHEDRLKIAADPRNYGA